MAKGNFTEHKEYRRVSALVNSALSDIAHQLDCVDELHALRPHTDNVADDMAKLFLRAWAINHQ